MSEVHKTSDAAMPDFFREWIVNLSVAELTQIRQWLDSQENPSLLIFGELGHAEFCMNDILG